MRAKEQSHPCASLDRRGLARGSPKRHVCVLPPPGEHLAQGPAHGAPAGPPSALGAVAGDVQLLWDQDSGTAVGLCGRPHIHVSQVRVHRVQVNRLRTHGLHPR